MTYVPGQTADIVPAAPVRRPAQPGDWDHDRPILRRRQ